MKNQPKTSFNRYLKFIFWTALAAMGQLAALQLIDAGKTMHYQHYPTFAELLETGPVWAAILSLQVVLVGAGLARQRRRIYQKVIRKFHAWQILGVGLVLAAAGAVVSAELGRYFQEALLATALQLLNLGNFALIAIFIPANWLLWVRQKFRLDLAEPIPTNDPPRTDRFIWLAALWVTLLSALLCVFSYQRHPHIPDEVAYLIQADFLANGVLSVPAPPDETAFDVYLIQNTGDRWQPVMPFGWPAMLALGNRLGIPWLINPLLGGLSLILAYLVIQQLYSRRLARLVVLLCCFSPWYIFMGMNFMNHMSTLFWMLLAVVCLLGARSSGKAIWAAAAGASIGVISLIRPLDGLISALLLGLWAIGLGGQRLRAGSIVALVLATAATASLVLPYNQALSGNALVFPVDAYMDQRFGVNSYAYGFGPDRGQGWHIDPNPGHSPLDGLINAELNTFSINVELFGWSTGSLWLAALFILSLKYRQSDRLMIAVILAIFGAYFLNYFNGGPDFGARYWFLMIIPLAALTARGMQTLAGKLSDQPNGVAFAAERVLISVLVLCLLALVIYFPWRAIDKYYHYLGMQPGADKAISATPGADLVFIRGETTDYTSSVRYNSLDFYSPATIYAWDIERAATRRVLEAYPERSVWFVNGPNLTHAGYARIAGPIPAQDLLTGQIPFP